MTAPVRGIDISTWQHPGGAPIDFEKVVEAGYTFVIIKATQGTGYLNPWLDRDYDDAFAAGLLIGAYHYFEAADPIDAQAKNFVGSLIGKHLDMGTWLDFEPSVITPYVTAGWVKEFEVACQDGRPGCGLYCSFSTWQELQSANISPPRLWVADYSSTGGPAGTFMAQTGTEDVPGVPAPVDVDLASSTRGLNIPTAPKAKQEVRSMTQTEPEPAPEEEKPQEEPKEEPSEDEPEEEGPEHQGA